MHNPFNDADRLRDIRAAADQERADYLLSLVRQAGHAVAAFFNMGDFGRPAARG